MNVNANKTKVPADAEDVVSKVVSSDESDEAASPRRVSWVATVLILLVLLSAAGAALWWQQQRIENTSRIVATRMQQIETQSLAADQRAREALALAQSQTEKLNQIDAQVKVARSDFATIEQSWRAFNHGVDDTLRANEIERLVLLANQQLSLTGQVAGSIAALEAAQQAIVRFDSPRFAEVGRAIQSDLSRLRATPNVDITVLFSQLDRLAELLNQAPLLAPTSHSVSQSTIQPSKSVESESSPSSASIPATPPVPASGASPVAPSGVPSSAPTVNSNVNFWSVETLNRWWHQAGDQAQQMANQASSVVSKEFGDIVRIRRAVDAQSLLMSEEQSIALRSHLRGLVLSAKLAMMMRQTSLWQTEMSQISSLVDNRFDLVSPQTKKVLELVAQLKAAPITVQLPSLSDSLNAVASLRAKGFNSEQPGN
jgi:uroporphyrin-3 C-methyltransferase